MGYYLVTGVGHELESYVLKGTGESFVGEYIGFNIDGMDVRISEEDLTRITSDDFHTILMQASDGVTDRLDALYAAIADGTY